MAETKIWYVDSPAGWFLVKGSKATARRIGREEYSFVQCVREATPEDIEYYENMKGPLQEELR